LRAVEVKADAFYTIKAILLNELHYYEIPQIEPGYFFCKYLNFSLNQLLKVGFSKNLRQYLEECISLSENDAFYVIMRKESSNTYVITPLKNLHTRIQPYLYVNGFIIIEFETFFRTLLYGGYDANF